MNNLLKKENRKWVITLSLVMLTVLASFGTVSAAEFPKGETIPASQTIDDDVFISGDDVVIDGTVNGILLAAGQTVTLTGTVNGDAMLFGETVIISEDAVIDGNLFTGAAEIVVKGTITGSVFGGSSAIEIDSQAEIARNMYYGGFSLMMEAGSSVGKDLYSGAYQVIMSGDVDRDLTVGAGAVQLDGSVGRNAVIDLGETGDPAQSTEWMEYNPYIGRYIDTVLEPGLMISDAASIAGKVTYTSSIDDSSSLEKIAAGTVVYQTPAPYSDSKSMMKYSTDVKSFRDYDFGRNLVWNTALSVVRSLIKLFILGALALWLLKKPFMKVVDAGTMEPLKAMGWGFIVIAVGVLALFIVPLVFVLAGIVVGVLSLGSLLFMWFGLIGAALSLAALLVFFIIFTLSKVVVAYMLGRWLMKVLFKQTEEKVWLDLLVGVFLYVVINSIPVVGWLASIAATLIGTGAFWLALTKKTTK